MHVSISGDDNQEYEFYSIGMLKNTWSLMFLFTIRTHSVLFVTIVKTPIPILATTSGFLAKLYNSNLKPSKESL